MKDMTEITNELNQELDKWFANQCRNEFSKYYLYYVPSGSKAYGRTYQSSLHIIDGTPACKIAKLAMPEPLNGFKTKEQNFYRIMEILRSLPILDA